MQKPIICERCGDFFKSSGHGNRFKEYSNGKLTGRLICHKCYMHDYDNTRDRKKEYRERYISDRRTGNQNPNHSNAKGDKFQKLTCIWKCVKDLNIETDNYLSPIDHSPDSKGLVYQTKGRLYNPIYKCWGAHLFREHNKEFDILILYCLNQKGEIIERIYEIPKEEIIKRGTITIKNTSSGWYEKYRIIEEELKKVDEIWKPISNK